MTDTYTNPDNSSYKPKASNKLIQGLSGLVRGLGSGFGCDM